MKRRETRRNGEGPDGTERSEDQMERIGARWNGGTQNGTEGDRMERRGTRRNGQALEETERDLKERKGTR